VRVIEVNAHISLNGSALDVVLGGGASRTLRIEGTNACRLEDPSTPLCSIDAHGASRVFAVGPGVSLRLAHLLLVNGAAVETAALLPGFGGCVLAYAATLRLETIAMQNCTAPSGGGGLAAIAGSLNVTESLFASCSSIVGGGAICSSAAVTVTSTTFRSNLAVGSSAGIWVGPDALLVPSGGGLVLHAVTGKVASCSFVQNAATTTDMVLLANPEGGDARGGGLFITLSAVNVSASTFVQNDAFFGGAVNVFNATVRFDACAFVHNEATTGYGGGLFVRDSAAVSLTRSLITGNSAGGDMGGGVGVINSLLQVGACVFTNNTAPGGCGGALGLSTAAMLALGAGTVVSNSSALYGGAVCCDLCTDMALADAMLLDNAATQGAGGAVHSSSSPARLTNVSLWGNRAAEGGAVAAVASTLTLVGCSLHDNAALTTHGGAILHDAADDPASELVMTRCTLANNTCAAGGGAVAAFSSGAVTMSACVFTNNSILGAAPAGGALMALEVATLALDNCTFAANRVHVAPPPAATAALGYSSVATAVGSGSGGALWLGSNGATVASISGCTIADNFAPRAGGVHATGALQLRIAWTTFLRCGGTDFSSRGGGLATDSNVAAAVSWTTFDSCTAVRGGGAWHGGRSQTSYASCTFARNVGAEGDGTMGIALRVIDSARVNVTSTLFFRNFGPLGADGTVALAGDSMAQLRMSDSVFDGNQADAGGCLYVVRAARVAWCSVRSLLLYPHATDTCSVPCVHRPCPLKRCSCACRA
jgi:hypothetical protein